MIVTVYAIYDSKSRSYSMPYFAINDQVALRSFMQLALDNGSEVGRNPEDFSLHQLGTYDNETGTLFDESKKLNLGLAAALKEKVNAS